MDEYTMGLDLGQATDYTALCVIQRVRIPEEGPYDRRTGKVEWDKVAYRYDIAHLERFELGTPYHEIVASVVKRRGEEPLGKDTPLVADAGGVGKAVMDMLRAQGVSPIEVTITGGDRAHNEGMRWSVPKRDLVGQLQVLSQSRRLRLADTLKLAPILQRELLNFRRKPSAKTARDTFEAREGEHDDLLLAAALAAWWAVMWEPPRRDDKPRSYVPALLRKFNEW